MSYLKLSRYALLACVLVWGVAMIFGGLMGVAWELLYLVAIVSGLLFGSLAANALIAQFIGRRSSQKSAKHG